MESTSSMRRLLLVAVFLEAGFILVVVPWSAYWDRNYFGQWVPLMHDAMVNHFVRGAVSGLGVVNIAAGLGDVVSMFRRRAAGTEDIGDDRPLVQLPRPTVDEPRLDCDDRSGTWTRVDWTPKD